MKRIEKKWKVDDIRVKMTTDDNWLFRGLLAIHSYQTADEKENKDTIYHNRRGFTKWDAKWMSACAELLLEGGSFSETMLATVRSRMRKYATQFTKIANEMQLS